MILVFALFFRFWQIAALPGGLFPDEAANGLDVNLILDGKLQPFYERGNGRESLFFYFLAASVAFFGRGPWQHHIVSAGFGFLEVLAVYFLTKRLFGKNVACLAAFFLAASSFATILSRTAFRANTMPLFTTLTLLFLVKFFQAEKNKEKIRSAILAGIFLGFGFYTYIAYRMMVFWLFTLLVVLVIAHRDRIKAVFARQKKYLAVFFASFAAAVAWLVYYFVTHPEFLFYRVGHVSIFSKDLNQGDAVGTFLLVFKKTMLAFFTEGDLNWRHNVAGFPFLAPTVSSFFAAGLLLFTAAIFLAVYQAWRKKINSVVFYMSSVALWFWFMLVPEITTAEGIPHGLRLVGVIPAMFIMPAFVVSEFWQRLRVKTFEGRFWKKATAVVFLSSLLVYNFTLYFNVAANSPDYYLAFRSDLTQVSEYINQRNLKDKTYLSLDEFSVQTVDYLTTEKHQPFRLLDPAKTFEVQLKKGDQVIFTQSTLFDRIKFLEHHRYVRLIKSERNKFGEVVMLVFEKT